MRVVWYSVALLGLAFVSSQTGAANTSKINGWFPCHESSAQANVSAPPLFECAEVETPMCHSGVCESTKTVNLFVKRMLAKKPTNPRKAVWFLQGGPGFGSVGMEHVMKGFNTKMFASIDLYTVDHRGTGRSSYLQCDAAQAFSVGSPDGVSLAYNEVFDCVKDILFQIENKTEAFSVTSAAKDVAYLIDMLNGKDADVYLYGASYGTYWASRVMHLAPKQVKGYILDGSFDEKTASFSTWNQNRRFAESRYVKLCEDDKFCGSKMAKEIKAHGSLRAAVHALYKRMDSAKPGADKCADYFASLSGAEQPPSHVLRSKLSTIVQGDPGRLVAFALLHRAYNCGSKDLKFLKRYFSQLDEESGSEQSVPVAKDVVFGFSDFLGELVKASEMWADPSPSWASEMQGFEDGLFSYDMSTDFGFVCIFRGNLKDPMCANLLQDAPELAKQVVTPYVYKTDKFWGKHVPIPSHASAMVINGALDYQTPKESGTAEYEGLQGGRGKIVIDFDTGVHCSGISQQTSSDSSFCGYDIIASYVLGGGDVGKVNTTCMSKLPAFNFADLKAIRHHVGNITTVDELYDS
ncbi:hypothetical protein PybrP1_013201 [[Pythium] brassicae (nom. inval.)]|nr:hypothetical protein PybrP1_013201 [[Pythium] brassicae (nom. inval.)]